jgi:hypothetical protein
LCSILSFIYNGNPEEAPKLVDFTVSANNLFVLCFFEKLKLLVSCLIQLEFPDGSSQIVSVQYEPTIVSSGITLVNPVSFLLWFVGDYLD